MKITAKDLKGTTVRKQLDDHAKAEGMTPKQKGDLTKKFLANLNKRHTGRDFPKFTLNYGLSSCFIWANTPEGHAFWNKVEGIYNF